MRKYNNPRLLNTVVSGTGMLHPVKPHVIVSDTVSEFVKGDLMDANAISELVDQKIGSVEGSTEADVTELRLALAEETAARTSADQTLDERITDLSTSIPQAISDGVAQIVAGADADYDTLKEISDYIKSDKTGAAQLSTAINNNTTAIDNEATRAQAKEAELEAAIDTKAAQSTTYTKTEVDTLVNSVDVSEQLANYYTKSEIDNAGYLTEHQDISGKANTSDLAAVATSGSYNDLDDKPTIPTVPTNVSSFTNDANYQTQQLVDDRFTALINAAPAALDTLGEIATKLADNDDAVSAIVTSISGEVDAREAADTAITTNITELASTVSANDTAINNKVDALETSLEDRISDVEDAMPTKVSDLKNDSGLTLNTLLANLFYRASNRSMTGSVNTYAMNGDSPYTMSNGSKYRVTVDDLDPEIVTSTMNGSNVRIESLQTVTYDSREFPIWYFETTPGRALGIAIWHGSESLLSGAITKSHNILIEELTLPTIDSKYIPSDFVNRAELNQNVALLQSSIETKLPTATFNSTSISHFENDSNYLTAKIPEWSVGDYLYSDRTVSSELDTNKTVIGVLVAPASHFDDGKARFVALLDGDTVTIEDIPTDYVYNNVVKYNSSTLTYDTLDVSSDASKVGGFYAWSFKAPSLSYLDKKGNYVNGSYYYTSTSFAQVFTKVVPAPYNLDGTKNTNYYSLGTDNILSILRETGDDWYIPTPREFGYLIYSRNIINLKISNAGGSQIEYSYSTTPYATSAVVDNQGSRFIFGVNRLYGDFSPSSTAITRQFIAIKQPTEYQFDVNGEPVDVVTLNSISTVAKTGSYNDLTDKPVIPTVPTNVSEFTNDAGYLTSHLDLSNYVTLDGTLNITGEKTFVGEKRIKFKQSSSGNKMGFTLYDVNGKERGSLEYRPNSVGNSSLLSLGHYYSDSSTPQSYLGFRQYLFLSTINNPTGYNLLCPLPSEAYSVLGLQPNQLWLVYIPLAFTDGTNTVKATTSGLVDLSSLLHTVPTKVSELTNDAGYLTEHQDISGKANTADLATVATTGSYSDLANKPTIPAAQIQSDWNQTDTSAKDYIKNKPVIVYNVLSTSSAGGSLSLDGSYLIHVVTTTGNIYPLTLSTNPAVGHCCHVILKSDAEYTVKITYDSTNRITPDGNDFTFTIPAGGYREVDFLNTGNGVFVRGI